MIKVKTLTGKEIEIDIEPTDSIERIKERVEEKEGIPPVQQRCVPKSSAEPTHFLLEFWRWFQTHEEIPAPSTSSAGARVCCALRSTELRRPIPRTPPAIFCCHLARHDHKSFLHPLQTCAPVVQTHEHPTRAPQQGLTLVPISAQVEHFVWHRGCIKEVSRG
jgi:hypothetical protein